MQIPDAPITQAAYARHRKAAHLTGGSREGVRKAVESGRLRDSLVKIDDVVMIRDVTLADQEWERNTDVTMRLRSQGFTRPPAALAAVMPLAPVPAAPEPEPDEPEGGEDYQSAHTRKERALADTAEMNFRKNAGELVPAADVENQLTSYLSACKTRLLAIPSRAKQALPHLTPADLVVLEGLVREALEELAGPVNG